jgi:hypothetical protein
VTGLRIFSIAGIPVWISPWFFLLGALYVHQLGWREGLVFTLCVSVSILVHELGHALVAARYRLSPQILLHGLGGLCAHERAERDRDDALILVAGPLAGLLLGVLVLGARFGLLAGRRPRQPGRRGSHLFPALHQHRLVHREPAAHVAAGRGRLFRLGLLQVMRPLWAERLTHGTSMALLAGGAIYGFTGGMVFLGFIALYFMHQNLRVLLGEAQGDVVRHKNPRVKAMLADVQAAYDAGDDAEVLLRGHRLRDESNLPEKTVRRLFAMLGVSTARLGRHSEALAYLQRAETTPAVVEAAIECLHMLDRDRELDRLLESKAFQLLSAARRQEILDVVRPEATSA